MWTFAISQLFDLKRTISVLFLVSIASAQSLNYHQDNGSDPVDETTCGTDELNHSILVECSRLKCTSGPSSGPSNVIWPSKSSQIVHIYSTRSGARFAQNILPNLNYEESGLERSLNINTTMYILTARNFSTDRSVVGFGATLDTTKLLLSLEEGSFERTHTLIIEDLIGESDSSGHLTILRLPMRPDHVTNHNLTRLFDELDGQFAKLRSSERIKIVIDYKQFQKRNTVLFDAIRLFSDISVRLRNSEIWALAIEQQDLNDTGGQLFEHIHKALPNVLILGSTKLRQAPYFVDHSFRPKVQGLLLKSEPSTPYNILDYLRHADEKFTLLSIGTNRPRTRDYGDWQNARDCAVELMNHLKHGSVGFIEEFSAVDVLGDPKELDSSIYSLHPSHMIHFKGPLFYAIGHFSRYLKAGSQQLNVNVFTQPNMFAAHYTAMLTPTGYVVAIVLNDNEHLLPFRLALDNKILVYAHIEAKSFNTFLIKT